MRAGRKIWAGAAVALTAMAGGVGVQYAGADQPPAAHVNAEGNAFTGGLQFAPKNVTVPVGASVQWTNTDAIVPHTATEDHGLWDLSGTYGSPGPYQGFGPGESRQRVFEAGTHHYYCRVHPQQMHGVVAVPVTLAAVHRRDRRHRRYSLVTATWAVQPPANDEVFDVERKRGAAEWQTFQSGTTAGVAGFRSRRGVVWTVRARLRKAADAKATTDWSPDAQIKA
jgi:plastocyanin